MVIKRAVSNFAVQSIHKQKKLVHTTISTRSRSFNHTDWHTTLLQVYIIMSSNSSPSDTVLITQADLDRLNAVPVVVNEIVVTGNKRTKEHIIKGNNNTHTQTHMQMHNPARMHAYMHLLELTAVMKQLFVWSVCVHVPCMFVRRMNLSIRCLSIRMYACV